MLTGLIGVAFEERVRMVQEEERGSGFEGQFDAVALNGVRRGSSEWRCQGG